MTLSSKDPSQAQTLVSDADAANAQSVANTLVDAHAQAPAHDTLTAPPPAVSELPLASFELAIRGSNSDQAPASKRDLVAISTLGQGGMGRVVLAVQRSVRRRVAVKTCNDLPASGPAIVREGVITGTLEHPNIPPVHALLRDESGKPVMVMKHIEGVSWASVLADRSHPLRSQSPLFVGVDERDAHLEILAQLCNALDYAHARGVIHRDIKPENVMLGRFGEVYLIDWGIAFNAAWHRDGDAIALIGTASFMAPEMVLREVPDARTDVYLLGATLHTVLVGDAPHQRDSVDESLAHALESPRFEYDASIPEELASLCARSLSRDRDVRPASARAFREAIQGYRAHRSSIAICTQTDDRLATLVGALSSKTLDEGSLSKLAAECRFGYEQSLREWPDNAHAREGLDRMRRALARHELSLENARGARGYLSEIVGGDAEIERALDELEQRIRLKEEHERAMDVQLSARERRLFIATGLAFMVGLLAWRVLVPLREHDLRARHMGLLGIGLAMFVISSISLLVLWKRFSRSALNRRLAFGAMSAFALVSANRLLGVVFLPGAPATLASDALIIAACMATIAQFVTRSLLWTMVPLAVAVVGLCVAPQRAPLLYNGAIALFVIVAIALFRRHEREVEREPRPSP